MIKKILQIVLLSIALNLVFISPLVKMRVNAATMYYVSVLGSDSNDGSQSAPWRTLQYACNNLQAGDTLYVRAGTYNEKISINVSGNSSSYITICNYPGETPIISGTGLEDSDMVLISGKSYIKFMGFEICNNSGTWITGISINDGSHHIEIRNNKVYDINTTSASSGGANGIVSYGDNATSSNNNIIIDGNEIYDCVLGWCEALTINGNTEYWEVTNNVIHDVGNIGIDAAGHFGACSDEDKDQARNGLIRGNTVYNCSSPNEDGAAAGLYVDGGKDIVIERNFIHDTQHGLEIGCENNGCAASGIIARDNLVFNNTKAGIMVGGWSSTEAGTVTDSQILNNTCYNNDTMNTGNGELQISVVNGLIVKNNIFYSTSQNILLTNFFSSDYVTNVIMEYNNWYCAAGSGSAQFTWLNEFFTDFDTYRIASGMDTNSIFINPRFVDETAPDLHLQSSSSLIDAGDPAFTNASDETDYDGNTRVSNGRIDIGAYELSIRQ